MISLHAQLPKPLSQKHQKFIEAIVSGTPHRTAYQASYPNASSASSEYQAWRLLQRPDIQAELSRLRTLSESAAVLTLQQRREYLARVVLTPATEVSPTSNADLIQEVKVTPDGDLIFRLPNKLRALYLDTRLAGELPPAAPAPPQIAKAQAPALSPLQETAALARLHELVHTTKQVPSPKPSPETSKAVGRSVPKTPRIRPIPPAPHDTGTIPAPASKIVAAGEEVGKTATQKEQDEHLAAKNDSPANSPICTKLSASPSPGATAIPPSARTSKSKPDSNKTYTEHFLSRFQRGAPEIDFSTMSVESQKATLGTKWTPDCANTPSRT